jgi:hypothetical protein
MRVRTDPRWNAGEGAGAGKPESNAKVWRSLDVDQHVTSSRPKGGARQEQRGGLSRRKERSSRRPGTEGLNNFCTPAAFFGSCHCDRALLHRYPLSLGIPNIRECQPRYARRPAFETRVLHEVWTRKRLVECTIAGLFSREVPGYQHRKSEEMSGKTFERGGTSASISCLYMWSTHLPPRRRGTSTRRKNRDGGSGYDLGAGHTLCDGGIDDKARDR